jgi:WD repeat-containing protein 23
MPPPPPLLQDKRVRLYDVDNGWQLRKDVQARMARWTVTDAAISHDQRFLLYSSIVPVVHVVQVGGGVRVGGWWGC